MGDNVTINDLMNEGKDGASVQEVEEVEVITRPKFQLPEWLNAETGEGPIESYLEHPMNFNNSKGMARVLRGLTGIFGSLNKAIIDVIIGALDLSKNMKKAGSQNGNSGVSGIS